MNVMAKVYFRNRVGNNDLPFSDHSGQGGGDAGNIPAFAQSFTVASPFLITDVKLDLKKTGAPTGTWTVQIRLVSDAGTINNQEVLAEETFDISTLTTSFAMTSVGDFQNVLLASGKTYAVVLISSDDGPNGTVDVHWQGEDSSVFSGGNAFFGAIHITQGEAITASALFDLNFEVTGQAWNSEIVSYLSVLSKVGAGASSTAKGYDYVNEFIGNAVGYLNAITRYDWETNWNDLDPKARLLVRQVLSSLVAIEIIEFDYADYGSRFEARDKVASLRELVNIGLKELRDQNIQVYIQDG